MLDRIFNCVRPICLCSSGQNVIYWFPCVICIVMTRVEVQCESMLTQLPVLISRHGYATEETSNDVRTLLILRDRLEQVNTHNLIKITEKTSSTTNGVREFVRVFVYALNRSQYTRRVNRLKPCFAGWSSPSSLTGVSPSYLIPASSCLYMILNLSKTQKQLR